MLKKNDMYKIYDYVDKIRPTINVYSILSVGLVNNIINSLVDKLIK